MITRRSFGAIVAAVPALAQPPAAPQQAPAVGIPNPNTSVAPAMRGGTIGVIPPFQGSIEFTRKDVAQGQEKRGGGYRSASPTGSGDRLDRRPGKPRPPRDPNAPRVVPDLSQTIPWAPFYTIHKIMAGMFDMYNVGGNQQALKVLEGMADWADTWTASKSEEHMQEILNTEYGGMAEVLYNLAAATNNDRWAKAGDRFTKKVFVNPLAMGRDELRGLHTTTHVPPMSAAALCYVISGDRRFYNVADFFYYTVTTGRTYVTGGTSNGEGWLTQPPGC